MHYFLLIIVFASSTLAQQDHPGGSMDVDNGGEVISPPSISTISGVVKPGGGGDDEEDIFGTVWNFLTEEWWRLAVAGVVLLLLLCVCCYVCRCCYLCWDCCTDPFWGCCPQCANGSCTDCLKLSCCRGRSKNKRKGGPYYEIDLQANNNSSSERERLTQNGIEHRPRVVVGSAGAQNGVGGDGENGHQAKRTSNLETAPQVYENGTKYFNLLHVCGADDQQQQKLKDATTDSSNRKKKNNNDSKRSSCNSAKRSSSNGSKRSSSNNNNNSVNDHSEISFSGKGAVTRVSMDKSDIVIEHGRAGRYQQLPEARSEWVPLQVMRRGPRKTPEESAMNNRLSRSMESFGARHLAAPNANQARGTATSGANSSSHADIAVATDNSIFTCHKYSQTDLDHDGVGEERIDFRLQKPLVPMPGTVNGSSNHHSRSHSRASNGFPLPKAPSKSSASYGTSSSSRNGVHRSRQHNHHEFSSLPRTTATLESPLLVHNSMEGVEKELLHGKETNILS